MSLETGLLRCITPNLAVYQWFYQESNLRDRMEWYIRKTSCKGTLWEDRIKSLPVEGEGDSLVTMAACIELNPVRAGLAQDPKDYQLLLLRRRFGGRCGTPCGLDELLGTSWSGRRPPRNIGRYSSSAEVSTGGERGGDRCLPGGLCFLNVLRSPVSVSP